MRRIRRSGTYYRVFKPEWSDPLDTGPSKLRGGRWNSPGQFGVLYLAQTTAVAASIVRARHVGCAIGLFDVRPDRRPHLLQVAIPDSVHLDVVTPAGVNAVNLPPGYPVGVGQHRCQPIGWRAYKTTTLSGIACRSASECGPDYWVGEELVWFDRSPAVAESGPRRDFAAWYPDPVP